MKEIVLITGSNGGLATDVKKLLSKSYQIRSLTTKKQDVNGRTIFYWDINKKYIDIDALKGCNHIIHLSGYSILKPWTKKNRKLMYESRIGGAILLFNRCEELNIRPSTFISASASGIYGLREHGFKNEKDAVGIDWVANMVYDWEDSANKFQQLGSRVVQMRLSLILSKTYGLLRYNLLTMKYGIGVILGDNKNPINWIYISDVSNFILEAIKNDNYQGAYNLANGKIISQNSLVKTIKRKICPYALIIKIPIFIIKLFIGEKSLILNNKISLSVEKLNKTGFICKYNTIEDILDN